MRDYLIESIIHDGDATVIARFGDFQGNFILTERGARLRLTARSLRSQLGALAYALFH